MDWLVKTETGQALLLITSLIIVRLIIRWFLAAFIHKAVRSHKHESVQAERKREDTLVNITSTAITFLLWIIGIIGLLAIMHVNIVGLITGASVIGVIVGLGGQNAIKDFLGGFFILIENQYRVGDIITISNVTGVVEKITLRLTQLRDLDGNLHTVPHGSIGIVTNQSFGWSNVNIDIRVSYNSDIEKVKRVINEVGTGMSEDSAWNGFINEPIAFLRVDGFGDSAVTVKALGKVEAGQQWNVAGEFRSRLKTAFSKNGIEIPFPQRVIHKSSD